ncbi:MAG: signal peptide peptidase SppA [Alphaproteobacteria bacterium]|nr:signal peptide peptidase SppA [Alphaproteobacteria bacterium]
MLRFFQKRSIFPRQPVEQPYQAQQPRQGIFSALWRGVKVICFSLGAMVLLIIVMMIVMLSNLPTAPAPSLPRNMVLALEINGDPPEMQRHAAFSGPFWESIPTLDQTITAIDAAATDRRVKGLYVRLREPGLSLAHAQELRAAVMRFKTSKKFAYLYTTSFGEAGGGLSQYYLASAFDEIWMQPMGVLSISGIRAEVPYLRPLLDKWKITPEFFQRKDYKTAYESVTRSDMTPENRQMLKDIVQGIRTEIVNVVPAARGISAAEFERGINEGLFTAPQALAAKLITRADYVDLLIKDIKKKVTGNADASDDIFIDPLTYNAHRGQWKPASRVALIYVVGPIVQSELGDGMAAAEEIAPAILEASEDPSIKVIVLRINSPGGSPVASESILRAVMLAKEKGKKVIVSMGETAASGGYWVASGAEHIFALPTTLTGSIGVLGGKVSIGELWKDWGVNWDQSVQWGDNAGMWSMNTPFTQSEAKRFNLMLDHVYDSFLERVAQGRNMKKEEVDAIAGGRVWTGRQALKNGLVDEIGGLHEALTYAAIESGGKTRADIEIIQLPRPKTPFEEIFEFLHQQGIAAQGLALQIQIYQMLRPVLELTGLAQESQGALLYAPLRLRH